MQKLSPPDGTRDKLDLNHWKHVENNENEYETKEEQKRFILYRNCTKYEKTYAFYNIEGLEKKYLSLCIMEKSIFVLSFRKKLLLPMIATFCKCCK